MAFWDNWSDGKKWAMGIASALVVAGVLALAGSLFQDATGVPPQTASFEAVTPGNFAIRSEFQGTAEVRGNDLSIRVDNARISYPRSQGYNGPRRVVDLRASLVEPSEEEGWKPVRRSPLLEVAREIHADQTMELDPFTLTISLRGLESISSTWLVFDVNEQIPGETEFGSSHAHSRMGHFSD